MRSAGLGAASLVPEFNSALRYARRYFSADSGILIGSHARGDAGPTSDVDLLLLTRAASRSGPFYERRCVTTLSRHLSVITYAPDDFAEFWAKGSLFVHHVRSEGIPLWDDGTLARIAAKPFVLRSSFKEDIDDQFDKVELFRDVRRFNGFFHHVFPRLYSIYKNVVFFWLAGIGHPTFNKSLAFWRFHAHRPQFDDIKADLARLTGFYDDVVRSHGSAAPQGEVGEALLLRYLTVFDRLRRELD